MPALPRAASEDRCWRDNALIADQQQAGLLIADVSGHGVPAAPIASMVKLAAASQRAHAAYPSVFLSRMNRVLCGNTQNQFVTAGTSISIRLRRNCITRRPDIR